MSTISGIISASLIIVAFSIMVFSMRTIDTRNWIETKKTGQNQVTSTLSTNDSTGMQQLSVLVERTLVSHPESGSEISNCQIVEHTCSVSELLENLEN